MWLNHNRARSLISCFCNGNPSQFHAADGSGYVFWKEQVVALKKLNPALKQQMQAALHKVAATKVLSKDVNEVVFKTLG